MAGAWQEHGRRMAGAWQMSKSIKLSTILGGPASSEIRQVAESIELSTILGGPASSEIRIYCPGHRKMPYRVKMGMTMSLIIKYLQENRELKMRMRMRIMLEGRTAINRSDISSGVMSPTRPGSLHPEQLI